MLTRQILLGVSFQLLIAGQLHAGYLDDIGLTALRARDASLDGSGVDVGQAEAEELDGDWQTDPDNVGLNSSLFTYYNTGTPSGASFDSSLESGHANIVAGRYYSDPSGTDGKDGIAPGVASIDMFHANYFYNSLIRFGTNVGLPVINQSFVFGTQDNAVDQNYDNYAAQHNTLFCNGLNTELNPAAIQSPASSYNCIAVGVVNDTLTPLADGRSKPDIVAPGSSVASYTTPLVSGAATLLVQSGSRGDAGVGTASDATDIRTIKALLLNSATKPSGWSHTSTHPLDTTNGAGILEVNQAQLQLAAGEYSETVDDNLTSSGAAHLPPANSSNIAANTGWNLSTLTNSKKQGQWKDATDHYFFECDAVDASTFNLTATLVWNRNYNRTNINNLDLFLYKEDGTLVASSISDVDNVEHLYELDLAPGRYVLQVYKPASGQDSTSETYALAFNFSEGAPVAASGASATTTSSSAIDLSWNDNATNETGYRIERRISGGSYSTVTTLAADSTAYADSSLDADTTYDYQIIATNDSGDAPAAEASATTYSTQEDWLLTNFGSTSNTGDGADDADPEFDGLANLIEFATGSDPNTFSNHPIDIEQLGDSREFSFIWRTNSTLDFSIGYSEDLNVSFTFYDSATLDAGSSPKLEFISSATIDSEFNTLTYGIRDSVTSDKVFLRLQVDTTE